MMGDFEGDVISDATRAGKLSHLTANEEVGQI